ncbi:LOW QUALITY PROTEIN: chalcone synthase [Geomicrobium sp. JCM 19039]|nr:LOW QUALITY PROTEIN: chalcone synthase [Geomicrobium sp. JCM 19039]
MERLSKIEAIATVMPENNVSQTEIASFARRIFKDRYKDIDRLLQVFDNGDIVNRQFVMPIDWYAEAHSFGEKNDTFIEKAVDLGHEAISKCLQDRTGDDAEIDAIFCVTSTGVSTPSLDARIMNRLNMSPHTKRVPLWGLGCAGGAAGLSRGYEYCRAFPEARVLILCIELCSLTFQPNDQSKSNLIGTSLFSDGVACVLMQGEKVKSRHTHVPVITHTRSTLMPDSLRVMGWDVSDTGLHVVFSRDIPSIVTDWLDENVISFLSVIDRSKEDIDQFVAHPGGKKVLTAYEQSLQFPSEHTEPAREVLRNHGNMSSPTVLYVFKEIIDRGPSVGEQGLVTALGPGFCSELLWVEWREER